MTDINYLEKHLIGLDKTDDECFVRGRYIGCIEDIVEHFIGISGYNFSCVTVSKRKAKKCNSDVALASNNIFFRQHSKGLIDIPFTGYPFSILSSKQWQCNFVQVENTEEIQKEGNNKIDTTSRKRKVNDSTLHCKAFIKVRTARVYNEHVVAGTYSSENDVTRAVKEKTKSELLNRIHEGENVKYTVITIRDGHLVMWDPSIGRWYEADDIHYCIFPLSAAHNHDLSVDEGNCRLDKRVSRKIKDLATEGLLNVDNIKQLLADYVENTLFCGIAEKPTLSNRKYYPTKKTIRNHIFLSVGALKCNPNYKNPIDLKNVSVFEPPSITNIVSLPSSDQDMSSKQDRHSQDLGIIAVHLGAGYHSPSKWPGYKQLCEKVCKSVALMLADGMRAGEAVAEAVKILENSEYTNAGFGSNLTENGEVECDSSIMDTSPDESGVCRTYFGSVANVGKIRNPVMGAYAVLDEQRRNNRLALGRVPPCFLGGAGAENWCRAHGVEACISEELKSETAKKSWKKYHSKLMEHFVGNEATERIVENERLDTVGAVALDIYGNTAAAVSSGGLLLKMPGRIGQAACYGCGCWAEKLANNNAIAVSTSGCGEQIIKTLLAEKCSQNLKSFDQPYEAIQSTLLNNFIDSSVLRLEEDKHAGILSLHFSQNSSEATVEIVWGHTTNSMIIGHMSTCDKVPKVVILNLVYSECM